MMDVPAAAKDDLERRLSRGLGQRVAAWSLAAGGAQNRSFRLDTASGTALLAKFYHQDRWDRLHREFSALTLLGQHGLAHIPRAYVRSDEFSYGVYSFEPGRPKRATELESDDLRAVAAFAADLHRVAPSTTGEDLSPAADASFSIEQQLSVIDGRLRAFETFAGSPEAYEEVRDLCCALDLRAVITELIRRATASMDDAELRVALPRSAWRVNTGDFGPQNLLFTPDGQLTALDFEASGWDDPARLVMGFVRTRPAKTCVLINWQRSWRPTPRHAGCRRARSPGSSASESCTTWSGSRSMRRR